MKRERELFRRCNSPFRCLAFESLFLCMCTNVHLHTRMSLCSVVAGGSHKRASDALQPELQVVVTCLMWVLGAILGSFSSTALATEPCLHLLIMKQATERKTGCQPGFPFPGDSL